MATTHIVEPGECLSSLGDRYGFFPLTLWNLAENEQLRDKRQNPNVLMPGDRVFIPDRRAKSLPGATGRTHRFTRKGVPAYLRLTLLLRPASPAANEPFVLEVDGQIMRGTTDTNGGLKVPISPSARCGRLTLERRDVSFELKLGHLAPVTVFDGARARLCNLGFDVAAVEREEELVMVDQLKRFQRTRGLAESGRLDDATCDALVAAHGS